MFLKISVNNLKKMTSCPLWCGIDRDLIDCYLYVFIESRISLSVDKEEYWIHIFKVGIVFEYCNFSV